VASASYDNLFGVVRITDPNSVLGPLSSGPWQMTFDEPLLVGDPVTVTDQLGREFTDESGQILSFSYQGLSGSGEPLISATSGGANVQFFLTDASYSTGDDAPMFNDVPFCFLAGTRIATPAGDTVVESLVIGDVVLTADGRTVPVKWIGRQTFSTRFGTPEGRRPVCVSAGALGDNLPIRDLRVSADHALLIDNVLVHAGALVNDTTIRRIPLAELGDRFVVYHIETENHDVVLAEGAPAETFIDNVTRRNFDNYAEYETLYGACAQPMVELDQPRAMSRRQVPPTIRGRIAAAAEALGQRVAAA
jgi:hypothetical protein